MMIMCIDCTTPVEPGLQVQVVVQDAVTGAPVEAWIGYTIVRGNEYSIDLTVDPDGSTAYFRLPPVGRDDQILVKVYHPDYRLWWVTIRNDGSLQTVLPFRVRLERRVGG